MSAVITVVVIAVLACFTTFAFIMVGRAKVEARQLKKTAGDTARYNEVKHDIEKEKTEKLEAISGSVADSFNSGISLLRDAAKHDR